MGFCRKYKLNHRGKQETNSEKRCVIIHGVQAGDSSSQLRFEGEEVWQAAEMLRKWRAALVFVEPLRARAVPS